MNLLDNFHMLFFLKVSQTATLSKSSVLWFIFNGAREDSAKFKRKWEIFFKKKKSFQKVKGFFFFLFLKFGHFLLHNSYFLWYLYWTMFTTILIEIGHKSWKNVLTSSVLILTGIWNSKCTLWTICSSHFFLHFLFWKFTPLSTSYWSTLLMTAC